MRLFLRWEFLLATAGLTRSSKTTLRVFTGVSLALFARHVYFLTSGGFLGWWANPRMRSLVALQHWPNNQSRKSLLFTCRHTRTALLLEDEISKQDNLIRDEDKTRWMHRLCDVWTTTAVQEHGLTGAIKALLKASFHSSRSVPQ